MKDSRDSNVRVGRSPAIDEGVILEEELASLEYLWAQFYVMFYFIHYIHRGAEPVPCAVHYLGP